MEIGIEEFGELGGFRKEPEVLSVLVSTSRSADLDTESEIPIFLFACCGVSGGTAVAVKTLVLEYGSPEEPATTEVA